MILLLDFTNHLTNHQYTQKQILNRKWVLRTLKPIAKLWYQNKYNHAIARVIKTVNEGEPFSIWHKLSLEDKCFAFPIYKISGMVTRKDIWVNICPEQPWHDNNDGTLTFFYAIKPSQTEMNVPVQQTNTN